LSAKSEVLIVIIVRAYELWASLFMIL
jgi:hypothetical protein